VESTLQGLGITSATDDKAVAADGRKVVLVGNPNVGKSVFFGWLTGMYVEVSNYPGTTVEISTGHRGSDLIMDTPGVYGVSSFNDEETVARDIILDADVIVNVVDAVHLERDLFLTLQLADMGIPMVVALNFMDEAKAEGIKTDVDLLSDLLGVPVIPTVATKRIGLDELPDAIHRARPGHPDPEIMDLLHNRPQPGVSRPEAVLILEGDEIIARRHGLNPGSRCEEIYLRRRDRVNDVVGHVVRDVRTTRRMASRLGEAMLNPIWGVLILATVLFTMYELIGVLLAQKVVGYTEGTVMRGYWEPAMRGMISHLVPRGSVMGRILVGEYGLLTMTITYLFGLLLPLVAGFYMALSILEDSGYLPRLAALVDRGLNAIGLNGRAVIPIILGFGCITMATITTRILGTRREKTIASAILNFTIPCSAQLGVIALILARIGPGYTVVYVLVIGACLVIVGTVLHRTLPGESSPLLINLPPIRLPRPDNILRKTGSRTLAFMKEAFPWFAAGSLFVALMQITGLLAVSQKALAPLTVGWLHLPKEAAVAFILGMVRRDFGAAGFTDMHLTAAQGLVALVTITLFVPCIASAMILIKERSWREGILIWLGAFVSAFVVGGMVAQVVIH
jgi:ferrous iron transport protein B